jgi:hypothetical protein
MQLIKINAIRKDNFLLQIAVSVPNNHGMEIHIGSADKKRQRLKTRVRVCYSWGREPRYPLDKTQGPEYFRVCLIPYIHNV